MEQTEHKTSTPTVAETLVSDHVGLPLKDKEEAGKNPVPIRNYWRLFSYGTTRDMLVLAIAALAAIGSGIPLPLVNIVFGRLVGSFNDYFIPNSGVTEREFKDSVNRQTLYFVYLFIGKFVLTYIAMLCFRITSLRISATLRLAYMQSLFSQPVSKIDAISAGTVANTITSSANTIQLSISDKLSSLLQALALMIAAYAIAFRYSWALTLVTSSSILFVILVYGLIVPGAIKAQHQVEKADEKHSSIAAEVFSSIRTVFALGAEKPLAEKYCLWVKESEKRALKLRLLNGLQMAPAFFATYSSFALAFWFGLKLYQEGHIHSIETVIIVFFSVLMVVMVLGQVASPVMMISKAIGVSAGYFDILDAEPVAYGDSSTDINFAKADISFQNTSFEYPTRPGVPVLREFSATIEAGKTTALVGPSGSGKSTIVALLERWYDLPSVCNDVQTQEASGSEKSAETKLQDQGTASPGGSILVDGHNINNVGLKVWRSQIGLVQQEPFLFNDTIYNNVAFGLQGSRWVDESEDAKKSRVENACTEAFADEFIQRLPEGYETMVGESGIKLSGGQRQRLAIARSIVKDPAILILDEATSSIDVQGEKIIQKALDRVSQTRTTLVIAHRLSTIMKAHKIIVLKDGVKLEEGTHESLWSDSNSFYGALARAQKLTTESASGSEQADNLDLDLSKEMSASPDDVQNPEVDESTAYKTKGFAGTLGLFLYEQRQRWMWYVVVLLTAMGAGAAFAIQSWLFAHLVEVFQYTGQKLKAAGDFWSLMFFILAIGIAICYFGLGYSATSIAAHIASAYREEYFQNILRKPVQFYDAEGNASGTLMSRLSSDPKAVQELFGASGAFPLISVFNVIGCLALSLSFGWKLALVTFFAAMPVMFVAAFMRIRWELQFEALNAKVFASSSQFATEAVGAFRTVSSLTMEDFIVNKYSTLLNKQTHDAIRKAWYAMLVFALTDSIELCAIALSFWYGGQLLASREYNPLQYFVVYVAIIQGGQAAGQFASIAPNMANAMAAANRILSVRSPSRKATTSPSVVTTPHDLAMGGAKVELRNVSFKYPTRDMWTFQNLNISVKPGQFVAFVGASGIGKTSIISLLERFYDPTSGKIYFDDQDIHSLEVSSYRKSLSLVSQEPKLFDGTIRDNVVLGLETQTLAEEMVVQACKDAEIHDFIISLPEGYSTELGINTQTALSGGQKQRLCLARALLRHPRLLLLDEATSSLDSQSERLVQLALERLAEQRNMTVIAVAHRLATIQKADVIFVFGEGEGGRGARLVERGSHAELLSLKGVYYQMCLAQALDR